VSSCAHLFSFGWCWFSLVIVPEKYHIHVVANRICHSVDNAFELRLQEKFDTFLAFVIFPPNTFCNWNGHFYECKKIIL
jgi:uncharacterized protein (DUF486 family)